MKKLSIEFIGFDKLYNDTQSNMTYANRVDKNQREIVDGLRSIGCSVLLLNKVKGGCPDILVGFDKRYNILMEIKSENGKLNEAEKDFIDNWNGVVFVVRSFDDAKSIVEDHKRRR